MKCFWNQCSNFKRCEAFGECVADFQNRHKLAMANNTRQQAEIERLNKALQEAEDEKRMDGYLLPSDERW